MTSIGEEIERVRVVPHEDEAPAPHEPAPQEEEQEQETREKVPVRKEEARWR